MEPGAETKLTDAQIKRVWERTGGKAWEPPEPNHDVILELIDRGYLKRTDGLCGFERFKDSMVTWTDAGRSALHQGSET